MTILALTTDKSTGHVSAALDGPGTPKYRPRSRLRSVRAKAAGSGPKAFIGDYKLPFASNAVLQPFWPSSWPIIHHAYIRVVAF